jgi:hypothetical protein
MKKSKIFLVLFNDKTKKPESYRTIAAIIYSMGYIMSQSKMYKHDWDTPLVGDGFQIVKIDLFGTGRKDNQLKEVIEK